MAQARVLHMYGPENDHGPRSEENTPADPTSGTASPATPVTQRSDHADRPRPRLSSVCPTSMGSTFYLIDEMVAHGHRDKYRGPEWITIYRLPSHLRTALHRACSAVAARSRIHKPGLNPMIACCMAHGSSVIRAHNDIVLTMRLREQLNTIKEHDADPELIEELVNFLGDFKLSVPDNSTAAAQQVSVNCQNWLKTEMNDLSAEIGVSISMLAVLSINITLAECDEMITDRSTAMRFAVDRFYRRVRIRREIAESSLKVIRDGLLTPSSSLSR